MWLVCTMINNWRCLRYTLDEEFQFSSLIVEFTIKVIVKHLITPNLFKFFVYFLMIRI